MQNWHNWDQLGQTLTKWGQPGPTWANRALYWLSYESPDDGREQKEDETYLLNKVKV